jgi:hypothetical protein
MPEQRGVFDATQGRDASPWEKVAALLRGEKDAYRVEADQAISAYDALMVDVSDMREALEKIATPRAHHMFDPWARDVAREALAGVSERVTDAA